MLIKCVVELESVCVSGRGGGTRDSRTSEDASDIARAQVRILQKT